jgi:DNA-binding winged helix-turn-helix (wHTH) protein
VDGEGIQLRPLPYAVLNLLLENPGVHVTRECLFETCWEGAIVTDQAVTNVISGLRKNFAQLGASEVTIRTVSKIGYVLEIHCAEEPVKKKVEERTIRVSQEGDTFPIAPSKASEPSKGKRYPYLWHSVLTTFLLACMVYVILTKPFVREPDFIQPSEYQHFQIGVTNFYLHDSAYLISDGQLLAYELATQSFPTCHADVYLRAAESVYDDDVYFIKIFLFAKYGNKSMSYVNHSVTSEQIPEAVVKSIKRARAICG